jgi:hypothetical protein
MVREDQLAAIRGLSPVLSPDSRSDSGTDFER